MEENTEIFIHATYVAFSFAILLYGALAYRQIVDNIQTRQLRMGEDRAAFVHAPFLVLSICGALLVVPLAIVCYTKLAPSVYTYALPLVGAVQVSQLLLRTLMQQTLIRTRGIIVRSILTGSVQSLRYENMVVVRFIPHGMFVTICVGLQTREVRFRIFWFSAKKLEGILATSTHAPLVWLAHDADETKRTPPSEL